jgi:arsenate reductase
MMSKVLICGIKNCDTMQKALKWLDAQGVDYDFHDYKVSGLHKDAFAQAVAAHGWDTALNRRGLTWRKLPDDVKTSMDAAQAELAALENPSIVKRPLLIKGTHVELGFSDAAYGALFNP